MISKRIGFVFAAGGELQGGVSIPPLRWTKVDKVDKKVVERVSLSESRIGYQLNKPGEFYHLRNSYNEKSQLGGDRLSEVYLRTESNNIYRLDDHEGIVRLINAEGSKSTKQIDWIELPKDEAEKQVLVVGKPFEYQGIKHEGTVLETREGIKKAHNVRGQTTRITEIVLANTAASIVLPSNKEFRPGESYGSSILQDFQRGLPYMGTVSY